MSVDVVPDRPAISTLLKAGLVGGIIAAVVNVVVYYVAQFVLGGPAEVAIQPGMPVGPVPVVSVVVASIVPALIAAVLLWALTRMTENAGTIFAGIAIVFALLSLYPALTQAGGTADAVFLALMHIVTAGTIVGVLLREL